MGKYESVVVRTAAILFGVGLIATATLFAMPLLASGSTAPTWVYLLTPLLPLGLIVGVGGVVAGGGLANSKHGRNR